MEKYKEIERSLIKGFRKTIWRPFIKAVQNYELINEGDKIMVCISGGKDSFLLAKCIQELIKHGKFPFTAHYVVMDPGYEPYHLDYIKENAEIMNVPIEIFKSNIFEVIDQDDMKNPCYLCARMRRGFLYGQAQKLGCNKIALGHHFDDVIETTLLSMFYGSEVKTMVPKLHSDHFEGLELIRPLYMVKEDDIIKFRDVHDLTFINCACPLTNGCSLINDGTSKRKEVKELIKQLRQIHPQIDQNIFTSMHNVNLDAICGYHTHGQDVSFIDIFNNNKK